MSYPAGEHERPTRAMWWLEGLVFLTAAALCTLLGAAAISWILDAPAVLGWAELLVPLAVGAFAARKFRTWGLRRRPRQR